MSSSATSSNLRRQPTLSQFVQSGQKKEPPDGKRYCGFQMHILQAAQAGAILGLVAALARLALWCADPHQDRIGPLFHTLAMLGANGLLLCALMLGIATMCVPFLVVNIVSMFLLCRLTIRLFGTLAEWPLLDTMRGIDIGTMPAASPEQRQIASIYIRLLLLWLPILLAGNILLWWLQSVVFRAFVFMREMAKRKAEQEVYRSVYCCSDPRMNGTKEFF